MAQVEELLAQMRRNPKGIRFRDLCQVCDFFFGKAHQRGSSHRIYQTPWQGDPRVNIQNDNGMAKLYQVKQVLRAIEAWRLTMTLKNDRYTYRVTWSEEDSEYVGLCAEFPSLSWLASTPEAALRGIRKVVAEVVADLEANGEVVPEPIATKQYSGKFLVRVPPELHRRLALEAAEAGVSLNRIASEKLGQ